MPHAFKATPNHPAVAYLVRLHADIGGKILENKKEAARLASSMLAVEHVIKLFNPEFNARTIAARRRQKTNPWFRRGTLFREALDMLRKATGPMTVREVTAPCWPPRASQTPTSASGWVSRPGYGHASKRMPVRPSSESGKVCQNGGELSPENRAFLTTTQKMTTKVCVAPQRQSALTRCKYYCLL